MVFIMMKAHNINVHITSLEKYNVSCICIKIIISLLQSTTGHILDQLQNTWMAIHIQLKKYLKKQYLNNCFFS